MPKIIVSLASFRFSGATEKVVLSFQTSVACCTHSVAVLLWKMHLLRGRLVSCRAAYLQSSLRTCRGKGQVLLPFLGSVICLFAMSPRVPLVFRLALWLLSVFTIHPCFTLCRPAPCARLEKFQLLPPSFLPPHLSSLTCPHRHIFVQLLQAV